MLLDLPAQPYRNCGTVIINEGTFDGDSAGIERAKELARRHGANALVIVRDPQYEFTWAKGGTREGSALAIRIPGR